MSMNSRLGSAYTGSDAANFFHVDLDIDDVSAEASYFKAVPFNARLARVYGIVDGAIATADLTITIKNNAGTSMGGFTIPTAGSAAGSSASFNPTDTNVFTQGQKIEFALSGAGAGGSPRGHITAIFERLGD